jgi:hypothetical protein
MRSVELGLAPSEHTEMIFSVTFWQRQATHTSKSSFVFSRKRGSTRTFRCAETADGAAVKNRGRVTPRVTADCCPARHLRTILAAIVRSSAAGNWGTRPGGADLYEAGAPGWERGESWFISGCARSALGSQR